ncbi:MAG: 23S rRNA (uracil(1939)-C(5))-methyltransferase RlmD [Gammaproteobacteria bacterium]|nr:23S rRNA (uracil(1939)-C(5))-methyltransferase RlmD [Gammaproteobacteria bacterium]
MDRPPGLGSAPEHTAEIEDLSHDGRGVARIDGKVWFVADALPGERARFVRIRGGRDSDEAQALAIERASPDRVQPACAHFGVCGGCALQHMESSAQVRFKQKQLVEALERIGRVRADTIAEAVIGPAWGYRRRARLAVRFVASRRQALVGFRERHSALIADIERCEVLDARVGNLIRPLSKLVSQLSLRDRIPQIEVAATDRVALVFRVLDPLGGDDRFKLEAFGRQHAVDIYIQPDGLDSLRPLGRVEPLTYTPDGSETRLRFEPIDFIQVNATVAERMLRQALDWLAPAPSESVLELFCGLGNFSIPLAQAGANVTALEGDAGLVRRAQDNARRLGLDIRFAKADLFKPRPDAPWLAGDVDLCLLDPPRSGAREVLPLVAAKAPRRIVYVSCHPATLARDAAILVHEHGYRLERAGILDMFPHTAHVESMALFVRA